MGQFNAAIFGKDNPPVLKHCIKLGKNYLTQSNSTTNGIWSETLAAASNDSKSS